VKQDDTIKTRRIKSIARWNMS